MRSESHVYRLIFVSPWTFLIFFVIPLLTVISITTHTRIPAAGSPVVLLINNICCAAMAALRTVRYILAGTGPLRYSSNKGRQVSSAASPVPCGTIRQQLSDAGFFFTPDGSYAEKKDFGYFGTAILYGGLFLLLAIGIRDNVTQFSGILLDGMGPLTDLNKVEGYRHISKGIFPALPKGLPRLAINSQKLPDTMYPMGATDVTFVNEDNTARSVLLLPHVPQHINGFDIYMTKFVFEPRIVIKTRDNKPLFDSVVRLDPLVQKRGGYSFYGSFDGYGLVGGIYYQPEKSAFKIVITRGGVKMVSDLVFQLDKEAEQGDYIVSCSRLGQWTEIHVVRKRHSGALIFSGMIAILGLLLRLLIRPQRVWLEPDAEGCRVSSVGTAAAAALNIT